MILVLPQLLQIDNPSDEATSVEGLKSFEATGFTTGAANMTNNEPYDYRAWGWLAGGTGVANTTGTIDSTVSANTTAGFSIVKYVGDGSSGATVGHGLSQAPELVIVKSIDITGDSEAGAGWPSYWIGMGNTKYISWSAQTGETVDSGKWNDATPSASVFTLGDDGVVNQDTNNFIAYCFHSVEGYCKISTYVGNGNDDGPFIYTGFQTSCWMFKSLDTSDNWTLMSNPPNTYNVSQIKQTTDSAAGDESSTSYRQDINSNGIKFRDDYATPNKNGDTYVYVAFAENPFKTSNAR